MSERTVEVNGRKVHLRVLGNGAPIVLLHGFPQTGAAWNAVADKLAGRNRVIIPDLPGFGQSEPAHLADASAVASMLLGAAEEAGAEKFALVGHDWGGSIALRMAMEAPERVERLVVVNAPFRKLDPVRNAYMLFFMMPVVPELAFTALGRRLVPMMIKAASANRGAFDEESMKTYGESLSSMEQARNALAYYRTIGKAAARRTLGSIVPVQIPFLTEKPLKGPRRKVEVPTLIVWGEKDRFMPPSMIEGIERDIAAPVKVVRLPDVGHFVPEEAPTELAHEIDTFLLEPR